MSARPLAPELWGGVECTVNRVGNAYTDQIVLTGHHDRIEDLDLFAALGLSAMRYPVLWERIAPDSLGACDWAWTDARLDRLRSLGIKPIAGLVHHGSGPSYTSLLDPEFAEKLGRFAAGAAARYDWIEDWTPVNEPLTTARFSALYGHWYPHARDERLFWLALLNQTDGVRAAMRAIRRIRPDARLIQTDDLGHCYATPRMQDQADFDNERRWAGWDLLFGRITPDHPLWDRLASFGLGDRLRAAADDPCPPDIIGVNHYLTSDRFLDHRCERYPPECRGGNDRAAYADVEAVRVLDPAPGGWTLALREAWDRYRTPLALTEVHNGCTRDEQLRYVAEAWDAALRLLAEGVDVRAVTAWALLGSHGWNTLLTKPGGYEPGVHDARGGAPRATALAAMWTGLPTGDVRHPAVSGPGWWRRPMRLLHPPVRLGVPARPRSPALCEGPPILIVGANGVLGRAFGKACGHRGLSFVLADRAMLDLRRTPDIAATLDRWRPWAVVNAAGWSGIDKAEAHPAACHALNATGAIALARACAARGISCVNFSSDLVFDGQARGAYDEAAVPAPLSAYGRSKLALELGCAGLDRSLLVRTAGLFATDDALAAVISDRLARGQSVAAAADHHFTPTFAPHLADAVLDLVIDGQVGLRHLTHHELVSCSDFARGIAMACGLDPSLVRDVAGETFGWRAPRPRRLALVSRFGALLPPLQNALDVFATAQALSRPASSLDLALETIG